MAPMPNFHRAVLFPFILLGPIGVSVCAAQQAAVTFPATDEGVVFATWHTVPAPRATIIAYHQGGASGEAEYGPIVARLMADGFEVLVVDQRSGGERFDGNNRTVQRRGASADYCDAAADVAGALHYVREQRPKTPIILWGSSYSAALVVRVAAADPSRVAGVLAFSPASGGSMAACRAEDRSEALKSPLLVLRPASEMEMAQTSQQAETFRAQGHEVFVAHPGTHGSSMLVESRVGAPVEETWGAVRAFLTRAITPIPSFPQ